jgi:hypothetical protein
MRNFEESYLSKLYIEREFEGFDTGVAEPMRCKDNTSTDVVAVDDYY